MSGVTACKVLHGTDHNNLNDQLADALNGGYQPLFGSLVVSPSGSVYMTVIQGSQILVGATGAAGTNGTNGVDGTVKTFYGTTSDAANTYTSTITGATPLTVGSIFAIKFTHKPTGAATMNINGVGAKPIVVASGAAIAADQGVDNQIATMIYDGTSFIYVVSPNAAV
jgi:hypothetical protein